MKVNITVHVKRIYLSRVKVIENVFNLSIAAQSTL